ncbi:MAG: phage tail tape measure protein [Actinobacteria bacterium]|nr:phage tail tape measure protein [Actinomycetota bacterium]
MVIGNLLYSLDIKPGDIEKLQAKLETLQNSVEKKARVSSPIDPAATKDAMEGIRGLRNEVNSLNGEFASGQMNAKQYAAELTRIRDASVAQMQSMLASQGATARTTTEYARLAGIAGNTSLMLNQMGAAQNKVTMGQQLLLGATRALRFQLVRLGPVGYGTSIMFTSMAASMAGASAGSVGLSGKVERLKATIFGLNNVIMLSGVLALISLGLAAYRASRAIIGIEDAQAEVARTTAFTSDELWELTHAFQNTSLEIGATTTELLGIASVAGQLGIRGVKNVAEFSDTLARLARVTDIVGEEGATQLARFLNITGVATEDLGTEAIIAGNIINELGNTTAASAREILKMGSEIAQVRAVANVSRPDLFAIGATLRSVGISAELAGTNLTKVFDKMIFAALDGGEALNTWSRAAGTTADQFKQMVKENPADALQQLALGLRTMKENGVELLPVLDDLGFKNIRERRIMAGLVLAYDVLTGARATAAEQVAILNGELDEQASIDAELERRMNTISFQWRRFAAQIGVVLQIIGEGLLPHMRAMVDGLIDGRDKVVIIGSSIVTLIDTLIYLGQIFRGTGQIILGFFAGIGGAIGEWTVQMENFFRPVDNLFVRMSRMQDKMNAGTMTGADWLDLAGIKFGTGAWDSAAITDAYTRHSTGVRDGMQTIIEAVEQYWAAIARIPETQAKMMGTLTELTNNVENALLRGELLDMLDEWEEEIESAGNAPRDIMAELAKTLAALDQFAESYRQVDPGYDNTNEKVSALTSTLRELSEAGFGPASIEVQTVIGYLQDLGVELDDILAKGRQLLEQGTQNYLRGLEIKLETGDMDIADVIDELRFQEQKLAGQLSGASNFDDASSILTRLDMVRNMLRGLVSDYVAASESTWQYANAQAELARQMGILTERFGDGDNGMLYTLSLVQQSAGQFESFSDAVRKLGQAGVGLTVPMLEHLGELFPEMEENLGGTIIATLRAADAAAILSDRFGTTGNRTKYTMGLIERTEGTFTSLGDALFKLSNSRMTITQEVLDILIERFQKLETVSAGVITATLRNADAAKVLSERYGSGNNALRYTMSLIERSAGGFSTLDEATRGLAQGGLRITTEVLECFTYWTNAGISTRSV